MSGEYDIGTPTQCVAQVICESAQEAADVSAEWEQRAGVTCEIDDLGVIHEPDDILASEPEDLLDDDEYR
jgi:hypothetical protein